MRPLQIVLAIGLLVAPAVLLGAWWAYFGYAVMSSDPYPTFMSDYQLEGYSYEGAQREFSDFVVRTFPVGSDAKGAIAQITKSDFQVIASTSEAVELRWNRHNGPCGEVYSIVISRDANGAIARAVGKLRPICF
jgi:hypothetical protein